MGPPPPPPPLHDPHMMEANGRHHRKSEDTSIIVLLNVVNALTQLLIGAVAFSAFAMAGIFGFASSYTQHIYLCVIGYVILMSQAILSFNSEAGWAYSLKYPHKKTIHWVMQILGSIFAIAGSLIRIIDLGGAFQTAHAITGLIAMILTVLSLIGGVLNFAWPEQLSAVLFKTLHACVGSLTITIAYICLCLGFTHDYRWLFGNINANLSISLTICALAGILISASFRIFKRILNHEY